MDTTQSQIRVFMDRSTLEVLPSDSLRERLEKIKTAQTIAIATHENARTKEQLENIKDLGFEYVAHVQARGISGKEELDSLLGAYLELGVKNLFVVGGDIKKPIGEYDSAYQVIKDALHLGYRFESIGVAAYPEGNPYISDNELMQAMHLKQEYASYMVSQMCFDYRTIIGWAGAIRKEGFNLPLRIGIPGVFNKLKLLELAPTFGIGKSLSYLIKNPGMIGSGGKLVYNPQELVDGLMPYAEDSALNIERLHFFTFNQIANTKGFIELYSQRTLLGKD